MGGDKPTSSSNRSQSSGNTVTNPGQNSNQSDLTNLPEPDGSSGGGSGGGGSGGGTGIGGLMLDTLLDKTEVDQETRSRSEKRVERSYTSYAEKKGIATHNLRKVAKGKGDIEDVLEKHFEILEDHMFGSMTRGTIVGPLDQNSDADVMYVLDEEQYKEWIEELDGAKNCLEAFKDVIADEKSRIGYKGVYVDRNVVTVEFEDYRIEIAPAFNHPQGGYMIPDTGMEGRSWVRTDPRTYKEMFETVNRNHGDSLRKAARAAKKWKEEHDLPIRSYHLEAITFRHMRSFKGDVPIDEFMEDLFIHLPDYFRSSFNDPVIKEELLDDYLTDKERRSAIKEAQNARDVARTSRQKKKDGKAREAIKDLQTLYGDDFGRDQL